jgi:transposase
MRYAGIDIAAEKHYVAVIDEDERVLVRPVPFGEDEGGYARLFDMLGPTGELLVCMEATGHYWRNVFAALASQGYAVAVVNPLRTNRFAGEDLVRIKTDPVDAVQIARFALQKKPATLRLPSAATDELRELVRFRDRLVQELGDKLRQLHRLVDLGFPEFTRYVRTLDSELALTLLAEYPTAAAFAPLKAFRLGRVIYDGRRAVGRALAEQIVAAAKVSVGRHHGKAYQMQVRLLCSQLRALKEHIAALDSDIGGRVDEHDIGKHLTSIDGIGTQTAARLLAELPQIDDQPSAKKMAAYIAVIPHIRQSGKRTNPRAALSNMGNVALRSALFMPTLAAVRRNPWLKVFYDRLRDKGKPPKVALIAAMRKLLVAVAWVARHRRPFVPRLENA